MREQTTAGRFFVTYEVVDSNGEVIDSGYSIPGWKTGLSDDPEGASLRLSEAIELTGTGLEPTSSGEDCRTFRTYPEAHDYSAGTDVVLTLHLPQNVSPSSLARLQAIVTGQGPDLGDGMAP